jgi:3-deoxy-D-manno-octulosonic-acid transferase
MPVLYSASVGLYHLAVRCAARWNPKAKAWVDGRKGLWERLDAKSDALKGCLWMHCASVGEFEQGRPVLEAIKAQRPDLPVLLTFFSPSGYEARKLLGSARSDSLVTHVDYLPADSASNARRLVRLIAPQAAIFVKYEFWYHHLHALKAKAVPTFLVSAIFRKGQPFFKWYGGAWRAMLRCYAHIFTQDEASKALLAGINVANVTVSGDTRFDRVMAIARADEELPVAAALRESRFSKGYAWGLPVLVCGSTWLADEDLILRAVRGSVDRQRIIIAPHELDEQRVAGLLERFDRIDGGARSFQRAVWSKSSADLAGPVEHDWNDVRTLIVDRMGLLARLYKYGDIAYVGGGFGDGIHSLLEAAVWGKPVIFGPKHTKFAEAQGLIDAGGGFEVRNAEELRAVLERLLGDKEALAKASGAAAKYVRDRVGATERTVREVLARIG